MNTIKVKKSDNTFDEYLRTIDCAKDQGVSPNKFITILKRSEINIFKLRGWGNYFFIKARDYKKYCEEIAVQVK